MPVGQGPGFLGAAVHDRLIERPVLLDQAVAGFVALGVHAADIGHHIAFEQVEQPADGVQQHRVVAGLGDGQVEVGIGHALLGPGHLAATAVAVLQAGEGLTEALAIRLGGALGGVVGAGTLQGMAKFQQIALGFGIAFQQMQQRVAKGRAQGFGHIIATALATDQQPASRQLLDRLAQGRARHAKPLGQHPLGRQPLTSLQRAFENHGLQLADDIVRQTALAHLAHFHTPHSTGLTTYPGPFAALPSKPIARLHPLQHEITRPKS